MPKYPKEKIDQHDLLVAWSIGMNDQEIAQKLGVTVETVKKVKKDLALQDSS